MIEKLIEHIKKYGIRTQLSMTFSVAIFLPLIIIGLLLVIITRSLLGQYYTDLLSADNLRVGSVLTELSTQVYSISDEIIKDRELQKLIKYQYYIPDNFKKDRENVTVFEDVSGYPGVSSICVYTDNKHFYDSEGIMIANELVARSEWFMRAVEGESVFWANIPDSQGKNQFSLVRSIELEESNNKVVMVMTIDSSYIEHRVLLNNEDSLAIILDDGSIVFSNEGMNQIEEGDFQLLSQAGENEENRLFSINSGGMKRISQIELYETKSKLFIVSHNDRAMKSMNMIVIFEIMIVVVTIVLVLFLVRLFNGYFSKRIGDLRNAMHQASQDEYDLSTYELVGGDEVSEAFEDLKLMVDKIKKKDAEVYETVLQQAELDKRQQEMEFEMLASKINPHFLYNTLETIRMKAFSVGDREVASAIKLLGKSMRYVLENTGTQYTSLEKELEHVRVYLDIQAFRFENRFLSSIEIGEKINPAEVVMLPLLLQPIVENAITHGLDEIESGGRIIIKIDECNDRYLIAVSDNGLGMNSERLRELEQSITYKDIGRKKSIGLHNINQRLILSYGESYGISIVSKPGEGTTVSFYIPKKSE